MNSFGLDFSRYTQAERDECDDLGQSYSDFHKDLYGFRPRDVRMDDLEGLRAAVKRLDDGCRRQCMTAKGREQFRREGWFQVANVFLGYDETEYEAWCLTDDAVAWKTWALEENTKNNLAEEAQAA